jgi:hypothetical protein
MLQVIDFLNQLDSEPDGPLAASVAAAPRVELTNLAPNPSFSFKPSTRPQRPKQSRISYLMNSEMVEAVKESLGARSNPEVGKQTFEYYVREEGIDCVPEESVDGQ